MKYTKATNYALHIMAYLVARANEGNTPLAPLAEHFRLPPAYLSKILTQLVKADLIRSTPGANGGYALRKRREELAFYDVAHAIEGSGALFTCELDQMECRLQAVMREGEKRMDDYLKSKTIYEVVTEGAAINHHAHRASPEQLTHKMAFLDGEARMAALPPAEVLGLLGVRETDVILDAGAGSGYLTIPAARATGGAVYALDLDERMLAVIRERAAEAGLDNVRPVLGDIAAIPLAGDAADGAISSLILHEVPDLMAALNDLYRVLKPGGRLLIVEYAPDERQTDGPPARIRIAPDAMERALTDAGFKDVKIALRRGTIYVAIATK